MSDEDEIIDDPVNEPEPEPEPETDEKYEPPPIVIQPRR